MSFGYTGSEALNAITPSTSYTQATTLEGNHYSRFLIDVVNQAIYWQIKIQAGGIGTAGNWEAAEKYMIPGSRVISRPGMVGIRVRAALAGQSPAAVVTVEGVT